jgi:predicted nucleic acid-binding protein
MVESGRVETMKPRLYLETTIPSYLTAWPSRDLVRAAHQQTTREWWEQRRVEFDLFVSQIVVRECQGGDATAAEERLKAIRNLPLLEETAESLALAESLLREVPLPEQAAVDALHIAIAAVHGMHYLLTWNCTHIANASLRSRIESVCREHGYEPPIICTPDELLQQEGNEDG